jgi:Rieske Fe-S protein
MNWLRRSSSEPLWKEEFSFRSAEERYVTRRQLSKFLVLTSFAMLLGNVWILLRSVFYKAPSLPQQPVARLGEIPVGGVKLFSYPAKDDHCILVRTAENEHVGYSQKCTHLSCAVYYSPENKRLECPCHKGFFSVADGSVLQGPPSRPLPRIILQSRDGQLVAVDVEVS